MGEYFGSVLDFQVDKNADIRKFVMDFIEEACKNQQNARCRFLFSLFL